MFSSNNSIFAPLSSLTPNKVGSSSSTALVTSTAATTATSHFSPIIEPPHDGHSSLSPAPSTLQAVLDNMQFQIRLLSDHIIRPPTSAHNIRSLPINIDPRPSSCHSARPDSPLDQLSDQLARAEAECRRLKSAIAARTQLNHSNLPLIQPVLVPPSSNALHTSFTTSSFQFQPNTLPTTTSTSTNHPSSSPFQPIHKSFSLGLPTSTSPVIVQPASLPSSVLATATASIPPSSTFSSTLPHYLSSPPMYQAPSINNSIITPSLPVPPLSSVPTLASTTPQSTVLTMALNNNLLTFKGLTNERPIQFLNDFEIRASALVGHNDALLLQTVQQVLAEGALIWFSQLQKSPDRITTWNNFKLRFYERYHTPIKVQNFRTELRLLFEGENESTLDYFDRLKTLMTEIDPDCNDIWLKQKFIQNLRSDIRSRLVIDQHSPVRDILRKAQAIESNIEQQKIDDKLRLAANQEKKSLPTLITNNLSTSHDTHRRSSNSSCPPTPRPPPSPD